MITDEPRRGWLRNAGLPIGGMAALSTAPRLVAQGKGRAAAKKGDDDEKISLAEDLTSCLYKLDQCNNCLEAYFRNCGMLCGF